MATDLKQLAAEWSDDWHVWISARGDYFCARFKHPRPASLSAMGQGHPDATVIADSAEELDHALKAQRTNVALYWERMSRLKALRNRVAT